MKKSMRWYDHITINIFWLGMNIRNRAIGSVFTPYLIAAFVPETNRNTTLGLIGAAGLVIAMLVQPAAGLMSDRSTSRFGRRRPYIFIGVLLDLVFLAAIGLSWNFWSLLVATLLIQFSANVSHGPLQGLIPDLAPEDQRGRASAVKTVMELLPLILVGLTIAKLVEAGRFGWAVAVTGAALLISMLLTMWLVKEEPLREKPATPLAPMMLRVLGVLAGIALGAIAGGLAGGLLGGMAGLVAWLLADAQTALMVGIGVGGVTTMVVAVIAGVWAGALATLGQDARRHASFTWWVVNRLMFLAATTIGDFALFFMMFAFDASREVAAGMSGGLMTMVGVFTLVTGFLGGWLADRLGRKQMAALGGSLAAVGVLALLGTVWAPNMTLIYIAGSIIGAASGLFMTANWALGTDLAPPEEAGRYLGVSNLAGAGAGMIGKGIGGLVADRLNLFRPGLGYLVLFVGYAVLFVFSVITLAGVRAGRRPPAS